MTRLRWTSSGLPHTLILVRVAPANALTIRLFGHFHQLRAAGVVDFHCFHWDPRWGLCRLRLPSKLDWPHLETKRLHWPCFCETGYRRLCWDVACRTSKLLGHLQQQLPSYMGLPGSIWREWGLLCLQSRIWCLNFEVRAYRKGAPNHLHRQLRKPSNLDWNWCHWQLFRVLPIALWSPIIEYPR